jgi:membrane protease YdiL (CAAX protease family)
MNRDSWRVNPLVLAAMVVESLLWTIALVVVLIVVQEVFRRSGVPPAVQVGGGEAEALSRPARVTISLGAGLYEELLFRMLGIALLHVIFVDLTRMSEKWGTGLAIALSAAAFAVYHDITGPTGDLLAAKAFSLLVAGVYFGVIYVNRGFGIVVAVHALYDIIVLVLLSGPR